jgi:hypothetical protein
LAVRPSVTEYQKRGNLKDENTNSSKQLKMAKKNHSVMSGFLSIDTGFFGSGYLSH